SLTVTIYMVFQGITPNIWGSIADSHGRRPVYLACLLIFTVAQIGLALIPANAYAALMILRCLSAAGSGCVLALGAATAADVASPEERGQYMGMVQMGPMIGPCIGPVFGGLLNQNLGWRAIFWFLGILSGTVFIFFVLFFPETLRSLVGNGSIPASGLNRTAWSVISQRWVAKNPNILTPNVSEKEPDKPEICWFKQLVTLRYILEKDVFIILLYNAFSYTAFYAVVNLYLLCCLSIAFTNGTELGYFRFCDRQRLLQPSSNQLMAFQLATLVCASKSLYVCAIWA
ncbi:MFS general substrate transporter, partial [Clavulina sp. PMI_390]